MTYNNITAICETYCELAKNEANLALPRLLRIFTKSNSILADRNNSKYKLKRKNLILKALASLSRSVYLEGKNNNDKN